MIKSSSNFMVTLLEKDKRDVFPNVPQMFQHFCGYFLLLIYNFCDSVKYLPAFTLFCLPFHAEYSIVSFSHYILVYCIVQVSSDVLLILYFKAFLYIIYSLSVSSLISEFLLFFAYFQLCDLFPAWASVVESHAVVA